MKKYIYILFLLILSSCASDRYALLDKNKDKNYLTEFINNLAEENKITKRPLIVLDGQPLRYDVELKKSKLQISKDDIVEIDLLNSDAAKKVYGEPGKSGIILITTKSSLKAKKTIK